MAIHRLVPAMEMIDFQNDDNFGPRLEAFVTKIEDNIKTHEWTDKEIQESAEVASMEKLVFARLGMKIKLDTCQGYGAMAAILPFYSNRNHIFLKKDWHGQVDIAEQTKLLASMNGKRGTVDNKNAKLGGIFSEYEHPVYLSFHVLMKDLKLSPAEVVAVLLHELGHGFYACEYADRVATCNQVLTNVAREISKEPNTRKADYVYMELLKVNPETTKDIAKEMIKGEKVVFGNRAFKYMVDTVLYQLDNGKYDSTSFENLADNFSARFGYGRALVSGLAKLDGEFNENRSRFFMHWLSVFAMIGSFAIFATCIFYVELLAAFYFGMFAYGLASFVFGTAGEEGHDYTYDDIKIRYKRIRDQLVERIKAGSVPKSQVKDLVIAIEQVDQLVKDTGQYRSTLDIVMNYLRPANYRAKTSIERQQMLEDLATNKFFVQSLKLQALA